jgi:hypothetical protein
MVIIYQTWVRQKRIRIQIRATSIHVMSIDFTFDQTVNHIRSAEYSFHLHGVVGEFNLPNADLLIEICEDIIVGSIKPRKSELKEKEGTWTLKVPIQIYFNKKNDIVVPKPVEFFQTIRHEIRRAIQTINSTEEDKPSQGN